MGLPTNQFPNMAIRMANEDTEISEMIHQEIFRDAPITVLRREPLILAGTNIEHLYRITARIIWELFTRKEQLEPVPLYQPLILAQEVMEDYRNIKKVLFDSEVLVIEENNVKIPLPPNPNSWLIERIQYSYALITSIIGSRSQAHRATILLSEKIQPYKPLTLEFIPFFIHVTKRTVCQWIASPTQNSKK